MTQEREGLWVKASPRINKIKVDIRVTCGLFDVVMASAHDYLARHELKPLGYTKSVILAHCIALIQGTPARDRYWKIPVIAKEWGVCKALATRCWTDYMAVQDGVKQLELIDEI